MADKWLDAGDGELRDEIGKPFLRTPNRMRVRGTGLRSGGAGYSVEVNA
jgi:hypothetical protein